MFQRASLLRGVTSNPVVSTFCRKYSPPTLDSVGKATVGGLRLVLLGAPGSGKGSFSKFISHHFSVPMISMGNMFRDEIKRGSELGKQVESITKQGLLVPDELTLGLLKTRLARPDVANGYILDGFPRTVAQAEAFDAMTHTASGSEPAFQPPNTVVNIDLLEDILIKKALARRVCSNCGEGYNLADVRDEPYCMPAILPKIENTCDCCSGTLIQRDDDNMDTISQRLKVYHTHAAPLLNYYARRGLVLQWSVLRGLEDTPALLSMIHTSLEKVSTSNHF